MELGGGGRWSLQGRRGVMEGCADSGGRLWTPTGEDFAECSWRDECARTDAEQPKLASGPWTDSSPARDQRPCRKDTEAEGNQRKSRATETERNGVPSRQTKQSSQKTEPTSNTGGGPSTFEKEVWGVGWGRGLRGCITKGREREK